MTTSTPRNGDATRRSRFTWRLLFSVVLVACAIAYAYKPALFNPVVAGLLAIAALPWLVPVLADAKVKAIEAFGMKIDLIEQKVERETQRLDEFLLLSMGDHTFNHLRNLAKPGGFGAFYMHRPFERELTHLDNLGYIRYLPPVKGIDDLIQIDKGNNLSAFIELTPKGRQFLELRQRLETPP